MALWKFVAVSELPNQTTPFSAADSSLTFKVVFCLITTVVPLRHDSRELICQKQTEQLLLCWYLIPLPHFQFVCIQQYFPHMLYINHRVQNRVKQRSLVSHLSFSSSLYFLLHLSTMLPAATHLRTEPRKWGNQLQSGGGRCVRTIIVPAGAISPWIGGAFRELLSCVAFLGASVGCLQTARQWVHQRRVSHPGQETF